MDTMKKASESIAGLDLTLQQIRKKADLYKAKRYRMEEINRLTGIEKRLDKIERTNTRHRYQLHSTFKNVQVLSQKIDHMSFTVLIPKKKLGTELEDNVHGIKHSEKTVEEHEYDASKRTIRNCVDNELNDPQHLTLKEVNIPQSNHFRIYPNENKTSNYVQTLHNKTDEKSQVNRETNLIQTIPGNQKYVVQLGQTPSKLKRRFTTENKDNRFSYHQKTQCFQGELLQPTLQRYHKSNFTEPNIIVTNEQDRLLSDNRIRFTGTQRKMTIEEMTERDFVHVQNVHSIDEWRELAQISHSEVHRKQSLNENMMSDHGHHYVILMDISESMRGEKFNLMTRTAIDFIDGLLTTSLRQGVHDNIGLACFGEETKLIVPPYADYTEIKNHIGKLKSGGPSPLAAGLLMAFSGLHFCKINSFSHDDYYNCIIVMTDGLPTHVEALTEDDRNEYIVLTSSGTMESLRDAEIRSIVQMLKSNGIKTYWIPFGYANTDVMNMIVQATSGKIVPPYQKQRLCRLSTSLRNASVIAKKFETTTEFNRGMVKTAVISAGLQEHDLFDDITDHVMLLLDPTTQYRGRFKQPRWAAIPLGTRVRRGPSWNRTDQDSNMAGTVIGENNDGMIYVEWDNGYRNRYRYDENAQIFDIKVVNEPRRLVDELIAVGCKVKRGKDWKFGGQDGGYGGRGSVLRVEPSGKIVVQWDSGRLGMYKFGVDGVFEVEVCNHHQTIDSPDLILPPTQGTNTSTPSISSSKVAKMPLILPSHKTKSIKSTWQYQNADGQWLLYDEETNAKIEKAFSRNSNGKCIIGSNNLIYIVKFTPMIQENQTDKTVVPVQRLEEKRGEENDY